MKLSAAVVTPTRDSFRKPWDQHPIWTLLAPTDGSFAFTVTEQNGRTESGIATAGDLVIAPPGATLARRCLEPTGYVYVGFTDPEPAPTPGRTRCADVDRVLADCRRLGELNQLLDDPGLLRDHRVHLVTDLLVLAFWERRRQDQREDPLVERVATHLASVAYAQDLTMAEVARRHDLSASQLSRRFTASRGMTPLAFVRALRMQRARELLLSTDASIGEIARECGYRDQLYFSRVFRAETAMAPSRYRDLP